MANIVYTRFLHQIFTGTDWDSASTIVRCKLERSTSTYTPNKDHDYVGDMTGFVAITVGSYAAQTVANKAANIVDASDRIELDFDNIAFGSLESGQTVKALVFFIQIGGDDSTPNDDPLIAYIDTDAGGILPQALGGGAFNVTIDATGLFHVAQA